MPAYICRWPNGDLSIVAARDKHETANILDEEADPHQAEVVQAKGGFGIHFKLCDDGSLCLEGFSEGFLSFEEDAYPILSKIRSDHDFSESPETQLAIRQAVKDERSRRIKASDLCGYDGLCDRT